MTQNVYVIAGPTASGKSALSLKMAREKNGVIINADSLQLYKDLPILTARPSEDDEYLAPHALYAILEADDRYTAPAWKNEALQQIRTAAEKGKTPILVGGTGFYLKTLMEGLSPLPEIPEPTRKFVVDMMERLGPVAVHAQLMEKDPEMAKRLNPNDTYRITRAWEVLAHTGKSLLEWQALPKSDPPEDLLFHLHIVIPERDVLHERCDSRFLAMLDLGALDQVAALDKRIQRGEIPPTAPVTRALGFTALQSHIRGEIPLETAISLAQAETRQYAKRQVTWFRNQIAPQKNIASITRMG